MGALDTGRILDRLGEVNYAGDMVVEVYRENFTDASQLAEAAGMLRIMMESKG